MVHIQKGFEPKELLDAKRKGLTDYDSMDTFTKKAVKEQLYQEQYQLCAYCMRRLDKETMQIEHYNAQNPDDGSYDAAQTINFQNMLGVCPGGKHMVHAYKDLTCDQHRKNIPLTVNPLNEGSVAQIQYRTNGEIYSDDPEINKDLCETLNLNCAASKLKENRKSALDALKKWVQKEYGKKSIPASEWQRILTQYCAPRSGAKKEYVGIIELYLKKKMRSAR